VAEVEDEFDELDVLLLAVFEFPFELLFGLVLTLKL
jgi:hypothetical protein